jgi:N-acetylneuraminic acid mutarotase
LEAVVINGVIDAGLKAQKVDSTKVGKTSKTWKDMKRHGKTGGRNW